MEGQEQVSEAVMIKIFHIWTFLVVQWIRICLPMQGMWV